MTVSEDVKEILKGILKNNNISIVVNDLLLYRPVFHEPPFENIEVFQDAKRVMTCNLLCMVVNLTHADARYEFELRYKSINNKFENTLCQVNYCDIYPGETPEKVQQRTDEMKGIFNMIGILVIHSLEELEKRGS